jgi:hypothetical protein
MALGFCLKSHLINGGLVGYFGYEIIRYIEPK